MYNQTNKEAYVGMNLPISSANIDGTGFMLAKRAQYTVNTAMVIVSTANSNLDGTGTLASLPIGAGSGTIVYRMIIKAQGTTTEGMIRLFHYGVGTIRLFKEISIPAITQSALDQTTIIVIEEPFYMLSHSQYHLKVSTEKAETFIVIAEYMSFTNP